MNQGSDHRPVLIVPFVWIGDFVRCHSVVRLLKAEAPDRPVDMVSSTLCAPIADYMPGVRKVLISDQPRKQLGWAIQQDLAARLRHEGYGQALVMSRKWKAALAPFLAGIPTRTGFAGEARFGLINDMRWGERSLPRMIDQMGALALPKRFDLPANWPLPELKVRADELALWRQQRGLVADGRPVITLSPGAVGAGKAWPPGHYAELATALTKEGAAVWVLGSPAETSTAKLIADTAGPNVRDLTGTDLRNAILALAAADVAVTNDSGLMHISAALGTPTVAIFGPTSAWHWKPLNPVAAILEPPGDQPARLRARTEGNDAVAHHRTDDVAVHSVLEAVRGVLASPRLPR
ncbi:MAG: lipopolysaccharide heptosyltransferase II [Pseudolabrys sp.]|nr:lipopolysaccharide heptosyltransferase II [Pseudolabrys sp.]